MPVDPAIVRKLLSEEEGPALDFKREQYRFSGASPEDKSEIVKDILAMVNSWRETDAYILIGVAEASGTPARLTGIDEHLDEASLQQFVGSKTNQPVTFSYRPCEIDGLKIGVIHIPIQGRPRFLLKPLGRLRAHDVFIRRGSSTDIAKPDEIALMGAVQANPSSPEFELHWANLQTRSFIDWIQMQSVVLAGNTSTFPQFRETDATEKLDRRLGYLTNSNYWRDLAEWAIAHGVYRPFNVAVRNRSGVTAQDVHVELRVAEPGRALHRSDFPRERPKKAYKQSTEAVGVASEASAVSRVKITRLLNEQLIEMRIGKVQPESTAWLDEDIYLGGVSSGEIKLEGVITADNLPTPQRVQLSLQCRCEHRPFGFDDLQRMETERFMAEEGRVFADAARLLRKLPRA